VAVKLVYGVFAVGALAACMMHGSMRERLRRPFVAAAT